MIYVLCGKDRPVCAAPYLCDLDLGRVTQEAPDVLTAAVHQTLPPARRHEIPLGGRPAASHVWVQWIKSNVPNMKWMADFVGFLSNEVRHRHGMESIVTPIANFALTNELHFPHVAGQRTWPIGARPMQDLEPEDAIRIHRQLYRDHLVRTIDAKAELSWTTRRTPPWLADLIPNPFAACDTW